MPVLPQLVYLASQKLTLRGSLNKEDVQIHLPSFISSLTWKPADAAGPAFLISAVMCDDQSPAFGALSMC